MHDSDHFTHVLNQFVKRSAYTPGQLARLSSVPKMTIVNWLNGRVAKPRGWQGVVELAAAMRLKETEADELLSAAKQPPIQKLKQSQLDQGQHSTLAFWGILHHGR